MLPKSFRPLALHFVRGKTVDGDPCWHVVAFNIVLARVILDGAKLAGINVEKTTVNADLGVAAAYALLQVVM